MTTCLRILAAITLAASSAALPAQSVWPRGTAQVRGIVIDSATGKAIVRAKICREVELGASYGRGVVCASPDSVGRYVLDSLPEGQQVVTVTCSSLRLIGRRLRLDTLQVGVGEVGRLDVTTDAQGCDMRPFITRRGLFRGRYVVGFEESEFRPCGDSISAWARLGPAAMDSAPKWPKPNHKYYSRFYVEWEGTLRGPWTYGHMGVASYEMAVERVRVVRNPKRSDCY